MLMAINAFVGLGTMGFPMAARLAAVHPGLLVWNRTSSKTRRHAERHGSHAAERLSQLRGAAVVFTCLPTSAEVKSVLDELRPTAGTIIVDCTSGDPQKTKLLARELAERGVALLDAPVSGGVTGAEKGILTAMVAGDVTAVKEKNKIGRHC